MKLMKWAEQVQDRLKWKDSVEKEEKEEEDEEEEKKKTTKRVCML